MEWIDCRCSGKWHYWSWSPTLHIAMFRWNSWKPFGYWSSHISTKSKKCKVQFSKTDLAILFFVWQKPSDYEPCCVWPVAVSGHNAHYFHRDKVQVRSRMAFNICSTNKRFPPQLLDLVPGVRPLQDHAAAGLRLRVRVHSLHHRHYSGQVCKCNSV